MDSNLATVLFPALSPVSSKWLRYQRWPSWLVCSGLWNHLNCYCSLSRWQHWKRSHYTSLTACCTERSEPRQTVQSALAFLSQHGCVVNCSLGYLWATQHLLCVVVLTNCYVGILVGVEPKRGRFCWCPHALPWASSQIQIGGMVL